MLTGLARLENSSITSICLTRDTRDCVIQFDNGLQFHVFNDCKREDCEGAAYWFEGNGLYYSIKGFEFKVTTE